MADAKVCDGCGNTGSSRETNGQFPWLRIEPHERWGFASYNGTADGPFDACSERCLLAVGKGLSHAWSRGGPFHPIFEDEDANA